MMSERPARRGIRSLLLAILVGAAAGAAGCRTETSQVRLTSLKDPYFPEAFVVHFDECAYRYSAQGDLEIVARRRSGESGQPTDVEQLLTVRLFWKPRPGKTFDDPSGINALVQYLIRTPSGGSLYEGTAFVYPKLDRFSEVLTARIEAGRLQVAAHRDEAEELLGESRLGGVLVGRPDSARVVELQRELVRQASTLRRGVSSTMATPSELRVAR